MVKKKPGGAVSEWLFGDGVDGTRLGLFAPLGHATFQPGLHKHVLCIAGGSGIAGMMSILERAARAGHFAGWDGHVFFGVRSERDGFFLEELQALRARGPGAAGGHDRPVGRGRARRRCPPPIPGSRSRAASSTRSPAGRMKGRFADVRAYVAGPPPMVDASLRLLLREARLAPADIRYDKFS